MAKKTATIPLVGQVAQTRTITAAEADAGLPTGIYTIYGDEAEKLPGLYLASGFIVSFYGGPSFQKQTFYNWIGAEKYSRHRNSAGWGVPFTKY